MRLPVYFDAQMLSLAILEEETMNREDVKQYDMVRLVDGRVGVVVDFWGNGPLFEFEYAVDEENDDWVQETCNFDDIVEILDSRRKIPESSIGLCC